MYKYEANELQRCRIEPLFYTLSRSPSNALLEKAAMCLWDPNFVRQSLLMVQDEARYITPSVEPFTSDVDDDYSDDYMAESTYHSLDFSPSLSAAVEVSRSAG
jgi:hypothetical protein